MTPDEAPPRTADRVVALSLDDVPARDERGASIRVVVSPKTTGARNYILGHAELAPGAVDEAHAHDYGEETIFVIRGEGMLFAQDEEFALKPGSCVFIPRGVVHSVRNIGSEPLLAIFANGPLAPSPELGHRAVEQK